MICLMNEIIYALKLLTIIPLDREGRLIPRNMSLVVCYFPAVGAMLGLAAAGVCWCFLQVFPLSISVAAAIGFLTIITGGLHLDGLADTVDGLFGGRSREDRLRIMRDPHAGSFGVVAVVFALGLRWICLVESAKGAVFPAMMLRMICFMPVIGRWAIVYAAAASSYARPGGGTGRQTVESANKVGFVIASVFPVIACAMLMGLRGVVMSAIVFVLVPCVTLSIKERIGGMTGDTLGAVCEFAEVAFLLSYFATAGIFRGY